MTLAKNATGKSTKCTGLWVATIVAVSASLGAACADKTTPPPGRITSPAETDTPPAMAQPTTAQAVLRSHADYEVAGTVRFEQTGDQVAITAGLSGLPPGQHGFHIHETGDCSHPEFETAGDHFNPTGNDHGGPQGVAHAGDLGNITAGEDGTVGYALDSARITLREGPTSALGRALVVHRDTDQLDVQPDGNAGPRIACGVIERVPQR
ncbi:MAG TPA: superoxide dismutase family protein [Thermoanaerobaculia bacterium]|nr:superoxide dismutase family protein [Thermoanaerobaculia bacterium]